LLLALAGCLPRPAPTATPRAAPAPSYAYVATAGGEIAAFVVDGGHLMARGTVAAGRAPVSLAAGASVVYAGATGGEVAAFAVRRTGALAPLGRGSARGIGPLGLAVHRQGKYLLTANGGSGTAAVLPIRPDGTLARGETYPASPAAALVAVHPLADVVFLVDGSHARITQFVFNTSTGVLTPSREPPLDLPPQSAPGPLAFHPGGRFVYVLEHGAGVVAGYTFEPISGTLTVLAFQTISVADAAVAVAERPGRRRKPVAPAAGDVEAAPNGRFLYAVDGVHDAVTVFAVDPQSGFLVVVGRPEAHGPRPVALALADRGRVLLVAHERGLSTFFTDEHGALVHATDTELRASPRSLVVVTPPAEGPVAAAR